MASVLRFDSTAERASLGLLRPDASLGRESGTFGGARALIPSIPVCRAAGFYLQSYFACVVPDFTALKGNDPRRNLQ